MKKTIINNLTLKGIQLEFKKIYQKEGTLKYRVLTFKIKIIDKILGVIK